jgi:hypothetical protein
MCGYKRLVLGSSLLQL